jgi:hypothetical protein
MKWGFDERSIEGYHVYPTEDMELEEKANKLP